jgi:hypothetical protein
MANCDGASVAIERLWFAGNLPVSDEGPQVFGCSLSCRPFIGAGLARFGRVDPPQSIGHAIDPESIAVNHACRVGIDR